MDPGIAALVFHDDSRNPEEGLSHPVETLFQLVPDSREILTMENLISLRDFRTVATRIEEAGDNDPLPLSREYHSLPKTAYWCAVISDGACSGTATVESGPSNVLRLLVQVPPGDPRNYRVRITGMP